MPASASEHGIVKPSERAYYDAKFFACGAGWLPKGVLSLVNGGKKPLMHY
jgi:hypothetical protein